MSADTRLSQGVTRALALACAVGIVVAGALWWVGKDPGLKTVTAYFPQTVGLYEDNTVRVRGVDIGTIDQVKPEGDRVKVVMKYDREVKIPSDAQAVLVAPSLVSDRFVQLTPPYKGNGPELENNAKIGLQNTAVPLEVDDLYHTLIDVSKTLGPEGANKNGELSRLLNTLAENFKGNGKALNATINNLGKASGTLAGNKDDLFATIKNLAKFTKTLAGSDSDIREFQGRLAEVSKFLSDERGNIADSVKLLGSTLAKVRKFIDDNQDGLKSNVDKLSSVTDVLVKRRADLAELLEIAPTGISNQVGMYNPTAGVVDARPNFNELGKSPITMVCDIVTGTREELGSLKPVCDALKPVSDALPSVADTIDSLGKGQVPLPIADLMNGGGGK